MLLISWVSLTPTHGGFYHAAGKAIGLSFLSSLTRAAAAGVGYQIPLVLDPRWMPPWPGKEEKLFSKTLTVRSDGAVDLRELERVLHSVGIYAKLRTFWKQLLTITCGRATIVEENLADLSFVPPSKFVEKVPKPNLKSDKLEMQRSQAEYDDLVELINILMKVPSLQDGVKRHAIELHGAWVTAQIAQGFEQVDTSSSMAVVDEIWAL